MSLKDERSGAILDDDKDKGVTKRVGGSSGMKVRVIENGEVTKNSLNQQAFIKNLLYQLFIFVTKLPQSLKASISKHSLSHGVCRSGV